MTHGTASKITILPVPADGEVFELTLDWDTVDPMEMVRADGYDPEGWEFQDPRVEGVQTRRFELVQVGYYCQNLDEVRAKVEARGETLAEGQWREAFRVKYPKPDRAILIGFGGSLWVDPYGYRRFPYLGEFRGSWGSRFDRFDRSDRGLGGSWRWLVLCK